MNFAQKVAQKYGAIPIAVIIQIISAIVPLIQQCRDDDTTDARAAKRLAEMASYDGRNRLLRWKARRARFQIECACRDCAPNEDRHKLATSFIDVAKDSDEQALAAALAGDHGSDDETETEI